MECLKCAEMAMQTEINSSTHTAAQSTLAWRPCGMARGIAAGLPFYNLNRFTRSPSQLRCYVVAVQGLGPPNITVMVHGQQRAALRKLDSSGVRRRVCLRCCAGPWNWAAREPSSTESRFRRLVMTQSFE